MRKLEEMAEIRWERMNRMGKENKGGQWKLWSTNRPQKAKKGPPNRGQMKTQLEFEGSEANYIGDEAKKEKPSW